MFENNYASIYGDNQAAYAVGMEFRTRNELPSLYVETRGLISKRQLPGNDFSRYEGIQSSGTLGEVYLVFLDYFGEVVTVSQDDPISIELAA